MMATIDDANARRTAGAILVLLLSSVAFDVTAARQSSAADTDHVITFSNRCCQQVWIGELGSIDVEPHDWALAPSCTQATKSICSTGSCVGGSCTCTSDADCQFGTPGGTTTARCDTNKGRCKNKLKLKVPSGWSGRFWPRTGCSGPDGDFICETGQCGPPTGGNIDCTVQNASANLATLFEIASGGTGGVDNFDVSLVSGYNVPVVVRVVRPADSPHWQSSQAYAAGAMIVEKVGKSVFGFTNGGSAGTSGATRPAFPDVWTGTVADGTDIVWVNTGTQCQTSGCKKKGIAEASCPTALAVTDAGGDYIGCDAPANACSGGVASCSATDLAYYQCQNNGGKKDLFNEVLTLQSANAGTFVCFSADDCPHGTTCDLNPSFADQSFSFPTGAGVCTPVAQNGGCTPGSDGDLCPGVNYPFVDYTCQTVSTLADNAQVCVPPVTSVMGKLWWNAANWTKDAPTKRCKNDGKCGGSKKCLIGEVHGGLQQCDGGSTCSCYSPKTCTLATCPGANQCLNADGVPDGKNDGTKVVACQTETCYCGPQGIYSGTCGPTNPGWLQAAGDISEPGASWPQGFKQHCPIAYSYQFDDPSSNWSCPNSADSLNGYRVIFCGSAGR